MKTKYVFDPEWALMKIRCFASNWREKAGLPNKWILGMSGGKDSLITAAIFAKNFGADRVIGVMMPNSEQSDIKDAEEACSFLGIKSYVINIGEAFIGIVSRIAPCLNHGLIPAQANINLPPRLRMATLYYVAQSLNGIVLNTTNLSERMLGYGTLYGDTVGSFAPICDLTVTELLKLGDFLGLPEHLVHKAPADGLSGKTDEDNLGVKYADVDNYIRLGPNSVSKDVIDIVEKRFNDSAFKREIINLPQVTFWEYPNYVTGFGEGLEDMYTMIKEMRNNR